MPQVATTVEYNDKDVRDLLIEDAKRRIGGNVGSGKIEVHTAHDEGATTACIVAKSVSAIVSFAPVPAARK